MVKESQSCRKETGERFSLTCFRKFRFSRCFNARWSSSSKPIITIVSRLSSAETPQPLNLKRNPRPVSLKPQSNLHTLELTDRLCHLILALSHREGTPATRSCDRRVGMLRALPQHELPKHSQGSRGQNDQR